MKKEKEFNQNKYIQQYDKENYTRCNIKMRDIDVSSVKLSTPEK